MNIVPLIGFTFVAWLAHSAVAAGYSKAFKSTKSSAFRVTHAVEIFVTVAVMSVLYGQIVEPTVSVITAVATVLGTLLILDLLSIALIKKLREQFDVWHFVAAYSATALAVIVFLHGTAT